MLEKICSAVREAGQIVLQARDAGSCAEEKTSHVDLVTKYDKQIQALLEERLLCLLPEAGFCAEEDLGHDRQWDRADIFIVDPLDGTTNFIKDYHMSCISVGLAHQGKMELGVVYNPYLNEMYTARRGQGAYLNGRQLRMPDLPLHDVLVLFGAMPYRRDLADLSFGIARELFDKAMDLRRSGAAALDLCHIAAGRGGVFFEGMLFPWDYAAGSLLVEEAGGIVTALDGTPLDLYHKGSCAAGNPTCHRALLEIAQKYL